MGTLASVTGSSSGSHSRRACSGCSTRFGFTLPNNGLPFQTRTIVVALLVGIVVTVLASLRPAFRATRVPPIAAVREGAMLPPGRFARFRPRRRVLTAAVGFAALLYGLLAAHGTTQRDRVHARRRAPDLHRRRALRVAARPAAGARPRLAGDHDRRRSGRARARQRQRNPQRTASTAAALMIGLALVTLVATLAAGIIKPFKTRWTSSSPRTTRSPRRTTSIRSLRVRRARPRRRRESWRSRACAAATGTSSPALRADKVIQVTGVEPQNEPR